MNEIFDFVNKVSNGFGTLLFQNKELDLQMRTILNDDGSISVNAEDTAIGFGWYKTENKNGQIYLSIRWKRMNDFSKECGFDHLWSKDDYIPESLFYMLAMKANNERAQKFQRWIAIDVIPSIRKTGTYSTPQAKQRGLTKDDYIRAASIIAGCRNERLPYVMAYLEQAGLGAPEIEKMQRHTEPKPEGAEEESFEEHVEELKVAAWERRGRSMMTCRQFNDFCSDRNISARKFRRWLYRNGYIMASKDGGKINYSINVWINEKNRPERCIVFKE